MAKVSLRIYNREIESLIDQGNTDEAVAHCHHILKTFPKHLETYRMLGKAHLESKRYEEAVDIFSRILMAVPEDFVSHVGMSIIRDEQNKLDDAIWHMERAFEAQPSNPAIQSELQRLYGRRDGMEPPRIRMTRGALAHMYMQGELYSQAIAEIRAVLAEDPNRADMQVLLARAYFMSNQRADASDVCSKLLKQYPYCLDANAIMVDLLQSTADAENTQVSRARVVEMNPYAGLARGSVFKTEDIPDAAVNLDRLEYTGRDVPMSSDWGSSLGIGLAATAAVVEPDWLKPANEVQESVEEVKQDDIPDFMRAAGWGESKAPEQPSSLFDEEAAAGDEIVPADLPDWLRDQAPEGSAPITASAANQADSLDTLDWLSELGDNTQSAAAEQSVAAPDWLNVGGTDQTQTAGSAPDWLSELKDDSGKQEAPQPAQMPDWLQGLEQPEKAVQDGASSPDWLSELNNPQEVAAAAVASDLPGWLDGLDAEDKPLEPKLSSPEDLASLFGAPDDNPSPSDNTSAWLNNLDSMQPLKSVPNDPSSMDTLGATSEEQDDAVAWLESLAAKHGAKPEELVTDPNKRSDTPPEWVQKAQEQNQQIQSPVPVDQLGKTSEEQDDAVAWLESLAAKHGAKPEELVSDPNRRSETPPEWVQQASLATEDLNAGSTDMGQYLAGLSESSVASTDQTGMWLRNLDDVKQEPVLPQNTDSPDWLKELGGENEDYQGLQPADIPDWLVSGQPQKGIEGSATAKEQDEESLPNWLTEEPGEALPQQNADRVSPMADNDLSSWLSGLDDEPGLPFDSLPTPASIMANAAQKSESAPQKEADGLPDWLSGLDTPAAQADPDEDLWKKPLVSQNIEPVDFIIPAEEPAASEPIDPVAQAEDLPEWLQGIEAESAQSTDDQDGELDDTPPWVHREQWEADRPQVLKPTEPSDWRPVEQTPAEVMSQVEAKQTVQPEFASPEQKTSDVNVVPTEVVPAPVKRKPIGGARQTPAEQDLPAVLVIAKEELDRGDIPAALGHYGKLIKKGRLLDETIRDLSESLYRYPVEVGIWQALGDAYMRANRLKEALESYNKAEELIR